MLLFTILPLLFVPFLYDIKVIFTSTTLELDQWLAGLGLIDIAEFELFNVVSCARDRYYFPFFARFPFPFVLRMIIGLLVRLMTLWPKFFEPTVVLPRLASAA